MLGWPGLAWAELLGLDWLDRRGYVGMGILDRGLSRNATYYLTAYINIAWWFERYHSMFEQFV